MGDEKETIPQAVKKKLVLGVLSAMGILIYWGRAGMTEAATLRVENEAMGRQAETCADIQKQATRLIMKLKETP